MSAIDKTNSAKLLVADYVQEDGSIYSLGGYLCWNKGSLDARLDGNFTASELIAIGEYMQANGSNS